MKYVITNNLSKLYNSKEEAQNPHLGCITKNEKYEKYNRI